jgi:flagellar biosynthesis/type III secretory pathway protein FliH
MTIKERANELYPTNMAAQQGVMWDDNENCQSAYIKGAEEWYEKGKEEGSNIYTSEMLKMSEDWAAIKIECDQLAARVKMLESIKRDKPQ